MVKKERNKQKAEEIDYPSKITKLIAIYQQQINDIMESGEVAPPGCWIVRYQARGRKASYWYYKLHSTEKIFPTRNPEIDSKYKHDRKAGSPASKRCSSIGSPSRPNRGIVQGYPNFEIGTHGSG